MLSILPWANEYGLPLLWKLSTGFWAIYSNTLSIYWPIHPSVACSAWWQISFHWPLSRDWTHSSLPLNCVEPCCHYTFVAGCSIETSGLSDKDINPTSSLHLDTEMQIWTSRMGLGGKRVLLKQYLCWPWRLGVAVKEHDPRLETMVLNNVGWYVLS